MPPGDGTTPPAAPSTDHAATGGDANPGPNQSPDAPETRLDSLGRWLRRASTLGLAVSLTLHAVLLLLAATILLDRPGGPGGSTPGEIELAISTQQELTELQQTALAEQVPAIDAGADADMEPLPAAEFESPVSDAAPSLDAAGAVALDGAGESLGEGVDLGGGAGGGSASFFGVEARGSRFAYVVDRSGSMGGAKIEVLREELATSIQALTSHASFFIAFYSHGVRVIGGRTEWTQATGLHKRLALQESMSVPASGATNPLPALAAAFSLRPRPDAIYFMTDGQFLPTVVDETRRLNSGLIEPIPIHTISFVSRESEALLRRIAEHSGGTYTHIEGASP